METVLHVLGILHTESAVDVRRRNEADEWLRSFQYSAEAWDVCNAILVAPGVNTMASFFAANTIRNKIKYSFFEIDSANYGALRDSIINSLKHHTDNQVNNYATQSNSVVTQLCLALVYLMIYYKHWEDPFVSIISLHASLHYKTVLEILELFPEEFKDDTLRISNDRAHQIDSMMAQSVSNVLMFITQCHNMAISVLSNSSSGGIQQDKENINANMSATAREARGTLKRALRSASNWIRHCFIPDDQLVQNSLVQVSFGYIQDPELVHDVLDLFCSLITSTSNIELYPNLSSFLVPKIMSLGQLYDTSVDNGDFELCRSLTILFCEMCIAYLHKLVVSGELNHVIRTVLKCMDYPDYRITETTFFLWNEIIKFTRDYHRINIDLKESVDANLISSASNRANSLSNEDKRHKYNLLIAVIQQGTYKLITSLKLSEDYPLNSLLASDAHDNESDSGEYLNFRDYSLHLIYKVTKFVDPNALIAAILGNVQQAIAHKDYRALEAMLTALAPLISRANEIKLNNQQTDEQQRLIDLLGLPHVILNSVDYPLLVKCSAVVIYGKLGTWFYTNRSHLESVLQNLYKALQSPLLVERVICALIDIIEGCKEHLVVFIDSLIQLIHYIEQQLSVGTTSPSVSLSEALCELYRQTASLLHYVDGSVIENKINVLLSRLIENLAQVIEAPNDQLVTDMARNTSHPTTGITHLINKLAAVFSSLVKIRSTSTYHPVSHLLSTGQLWSYLRMFCIKFQRDELLIEHWSRLMKHILRTLEDHAVVVIGDLIELVQSIYLSTYHSSLLYLMSIVLALFPNSPRHSELFPSLYNVCMNLANSTFKYLDPENTGRVSNSVAQDHCYLVEDFYRLMTRCSQEAPEQFMQSEQAQRSFYFAIGALAHVTYEAYQSITWYLTKFISHANHIDNPQLIAATDQVLQTHGRFLIETFLKCLRGDVCLSWVEMVSTIIYELLQFTKIQEKYYPISTTNQQLLSWTIDCFAQIPNNILSPAAKANFIEYLPTCTSHTQLEDQSIILAQSFTGKNKIIV